MSTYYCFSVLSTINTCLTLRLAHSLAPAGNTHFYQGTTIGKTENEKIYYACCRL